MTQDRVTSSGPAGRARSKDLRDVYDEVSGAYTGDLDGDLSNHGVPPQLADELSRAAAAWACQLPVPPEYSAALAFSVGLMTGVRWARANPAAEGG